MYSEANQQKQPSLLEELLHLVQSVRALEDRINRLEERQQSVESQAGVVPELLTPVEAAKLMQISKSQVYEKCAAGEIPTTRIGRSVRIPRKALMEWIEKGGTEPADDSWLRAIR